MIERTSSPDGQMFLETDIELNMFWTSLGETDQEIIELYHAHGESEQFHSEIKSDMAWSDSLQASLIPMNLSSN